jgi:hypothetical protein
MIKNEIRNEANQIIKDVCYSAGQQADSGGEQ